MKRIGIFLATLILTTFFVAAQKGVDTGTKFGHGEDSIRCGKSLSVYDQDFREKKFREAYEFWLVAFNECPLSTINLYTQGAVIVGFMHENEAIDSTKEAFFALLMKVYDQRATYFGGNPKYPAAYIMGLKALDMLKYKGNDPNVRIQAYKYFRDNITLAPNTIQPAIISSYFTTTINLYSDKVLTSEEVVANYMETISLIEKELAIEKKAAKLATLNDIRANVDLIFVGSGAADCITLEKIYSSQFEANQTNVEWLKNILQILTKQNCDESNIFFIASEALYRIEPSAMAAYGIAIMNLKKKDIDGAKSYFHKAIGLEKDSILKAKYQHQLALILFNQGELLASKEMAVQAISNNSNLGEPYILIGKLYATGSKNYGANEFEKKTVFWVAVDKFLKAKQIDPKLSEEANAQIATFSLYFPSKEELFFQGLKEGDVYQVGGWINEKSTIRIKK